MPPKIDPYACKHAHLHPQRMDGSMTICLDCESMVVVKQAHYASGKPERQQYEEARRILDAMNGD